MDAQKLHIRGHNANAMSVIKSLDSFEWEMGDSVDFATLIDHPNLSLYCLDDERQWALFAMLPDGIDLSRVPFVYQAHLDHAEYLVAVPYDLFFKLADAIEVDASHLICIHNIGRCGSTLMSQALNEIDGVYALSEPDAIANLVALRHLPHEQQLRLLRASVKMLYRPAVVNDASRFVLKLRNQCVDMMDVFIEAFPEANHLFMYRDCIDWLSSFYGLWVRRDIENLSPTLTRTDTIEHLATYYNRPIASIEPYFDPARDSYFVLVGRSISWLIAMERYLEIYQENPILRAIRYEDLTAHRNEMLSQIFADLDLPPYALSQALAAFQRDSQAGTGLAREKGQSGNKVRLPDDQIEKVNQILSEQTMINHAGYLLPGTIRLT